VIDERRAFALLGDPVDHSLSPVIYREAFRYLGITATYEARRIPADRHDLLRSTLRALASRGGGNVTIPHKRTAAAYVDVRLTAAERSGAVNCFWKDRSGRVLGDNTDVSGFRSAVRDFGSLTLRDASVLLLGAGGAARAVAVACADEGVKRLSLLNRTPARAAEAIQDLSAGEWARTVSVEEARQFRYDLVVNATSLGLAPEDPLPIALGGLSAGHALDLVYGAAGTPWTVHADSLGIPARDGLSMLIQQAVHSVDRWFGVGAETEDLAAAMLKAARAALRA
jgi:shikimate dehydrogenase